MVDKVSTYLYIKKEVPETAKQIGLKVSKVSENALLDAIGRLKEPKQETGLQNLTIDLRAGAGI